MEKYLARVRKAMGNNLQAALIAGQIEGVIFSLASEMTDGVYNGGQWEDLEIAPGIFITYSKSVPLDPRDGKIKVTGPLNGNSANVNAETFGAILSALALNWVLNKLSERMNVDGLIDLWHELHGAICDIETGPISVSDYAYIND